MIAVANWDEIRRMYYADHLSKRKIAKRLDLHRDTVSAAIVAEQPLASLPLLKPTDITMVLHSVEQKNYPMKADLLRVYWTKTPFELNFAPDHRAYYSLIRFAFDSPARDFSHAQAFQSSRHYARKCFSSVSPSPLGIRMYSPLP
jgi:hypothetical protein